MSLQSKQDVAASTIDTRPSVSLYEAIPHILQNHTYSGKKACCESEILKGHRLPHLRISAAADMSSSQGL